MLEAVGHPVAVNPDSKLERHARRNRMADCDLQPAHQVSDPALPLRSRHSRYRRRWFRNRHTKSAVNRRSNSIFRR